MRIFLLETAIVIRENWILKRLLPGTTSCSSCAVHLSSARLPLRSGPVYSLFPLSATRQTRGKKRCVNGDCFPCLPSCDKGIGKGSTDRGLQSACLIFNNSEAHLLNLFHAVSCNNSSDKHALVMKFSSAWFQTETGCTSGRRAARSSCSGAVFRWGRSALSSPSSCPRLRPSPSGPRRNGPAGHSPTSWTLGLGCRRRGSYCDPWRHPTQWPQLDVHCPFDQTPCALSTCS